MSTPEREVYRRAFEDLPPPSYGRGDPFARPAPPRPASIRDVFAGQQEPEEPEHEGASFFQQAGDRFGSVVDRVAGALSGRGAEGPSHAELERQYRESLPEPERRRQRVLARSGAPTAGPGEAAAQSSEALARDPKARSMADVLARKTVETAGDVGEQFAERFPRSGRFFSSVFPRVYEGVGALLEAGPESTRPAGRSIRETFARQAERMEAPTSDLPRFEKTVISALGSTAPALGGAGVTQATRIPAIAGAGTAMLPVSASTMQRELADAGLPEEDVRTGVRIGAPIISALEAVVPADVATRIIPGAGRVLAEGFARRVARGALREGTQEAMTEALQEQVPLITRLALEEDPSLDADEIREHLINTAYASGAGFTVGGILGAGGTAVSQPATGPEQEQLEDVPEPVRRAVENYRRNREQVEAVGQTPTPSAPETELMVNEAGEQALVSRNTQAGQPRNDGEGLQGPYRITFTRPDVGVPGGLSGMVHQDAATFEEARQIALEAGFQPVAESAPSIEAPEPATAPEPVEAAEAPETAEEEVGAPAPPVGPSSPESAQAGPAEEAIEPEPEPAVEPEPEPEVPATELEPAWDPPEVAAQGTETRVITADDAQYPARYAIVPAEQAPTSHHPVSFQQTAGFPEQTQERRYHDDRSAQEEVATRSANLVPERILDPTFAATEGPPIITERGLRLSGNQRGMLVERARELHPDRYQSYLEQLAGSAETFGMDPEQATAAIESITEAGQTPELVRVLTDDQGIAAPELMSKFNDPGTKARDVHGEAATRARRLQGSGAIEALNETLETEETVRSYLSQARSRPFVQALVEGGVIPTQEASRFVDQKTGLLNQEGKQLTENMLESLAIGDPEVVARAPAGWKRKISKATPAIVQTKAAGWDVSSVLAEAMDAGAVARANDITLEDLGAQTGMFAEQQQEQEFSDRAIAVAKFLQETNPNRVAAALRRVAEDAGASTTVDMFGTRPESLEESIARHLTLEGAEQEDAAEALFEIENRVDPLDPGARSLFDPEPAATEQEQPIGGRLSGRLETPEDPGELVSRPEIIEKLEGAIRAAGGKTPLRVGRLGPGGRSARGVFKVDPEVIRLREANNIATATHEVAHAIEKHVFGFPSGSPWQKPLVSRQMQKELVALGRELYGDTKPSGGYKREGFAEYVRYYVTDPQAAAEKAPTFHREFFESSFAEDYADVVDALRQARQSVSEFREQGSVGRGLAGIVPAPTLRERAGEAIANAPARLYEEVVESAQPLYELAREAERRAGRELDPAEDPFFTASALRLTHSARARYMIEKGMIDLAGNRTGDPALEDARPLIEKAPLPDHLASIGDRGQLFSVYLWARRSRALLTDPEGARDPGLPLEDAEQIIEELDSEEFRRAADIVYQWNRGVLQYAAEASPTFARVVDRVTERDPGDYIPLRREFDELRSMWQSAGTGATSRSPVRRLVGSGRRIKNPFESMISQAEETIRAAHQRMVLDQVLRLSQIEGLGHLVEEVPRDQVPAVSRTVGDLLDQVAGRLNESGDVEGLEALGEAAEAIEGDLLGEAVTFFAPKWHPHAKPDELVIPVWDGEAGRPRWYQVSEGLYQALSGMDMQRIPMTLDLLFGIPTRLFRAGTTTARASFGLLWNPLKDLQTFAVNTRASSANVPRLLGEAFVGMVDAMTYKVTGGRGGSEFMDTFVRLGGEMAQPLGEDLPQTRRAATRLTSGRVERTLDPRQWYDAYRDFIQGPEAGPRIAELKGVAKDVGWEPGEPMTLEQSLQLLLAAKQVTTDFTSAGRSGRMWNQMVPFFNASIQGPRATGRAARRNPRVVAARLLQMSVLGLALWWLYKDEEWYREKPYAERYRYWYFPVTIGENETLMRIPRAHDIGAGTAVVQALAEAAYDQDPDGFSEWWDNLWKVSRPSLLPQTLDVAAEQLANREFFFDTPIVPMGEERRPPEEQFNEYTDRVSVLLGDMFNLSPRRIEHVREGILGRVSTDILRLVGLGGQGPVGDRESEPADWPVLGRALQRGGRINPGAKSIRDLYDALEEAQRRQASVKQEETPAQRQLRLQLSDAARAISALSTVRRHTPEAARRAVINRHIARLAREAMDDYEAGQVNRGRYRGIRKQAEVDERQAAGAAN